jgi:hypothetical protein
MSMVQYTSLIVKVNSLFLWIYPKRIVMVLVIFLNVIYDFSLEKKCVLIIYEKYTILSSYFRISHKTVTKPKE